MILWGPAGSGKTTLARLVAADAGYHVEGVSAVASGVKEIRSALESARERLGLNGRRTVLFIDEVHRFNKAQQDLLLPATEHGDVVLIGATTENPYFEVNAALMSRCTLWRLQALDHDALEKVLARAESALGVRFSPDARAALMDATEGDARAMLTSAETAALLVEKGKEITLEVVARARDGRLFHQGPDSHYDQTSALIKSIRGSDPDAAVYWLVRLLEAGESPRFLARRLVIFASEDIGLAQSSALVLAEAGARAVEFVGLPEARLTLTHVALALALAPKSNTVTRSLASALGALQRANGDVPAHLRDAHYAGAKEVGHGTGYLYPHDDPRGVVEQRYLPEGLSPGEIYSPGGHGEESALVDDWRARWASHPD